MKDIKIAIIGLGYVGLPLARLFATKYSVVGFDINIKRIAELQKGKDVWVAIRDVPEDENNPKSGHKVMMDLMEEPFIKENIDKILISMIPDIESVNYGRGVGYDVIYHEPPPEVEVISGTAIRIGHMNSDGTIINN